MNKVLEYIIRAKDATGSAVSSALSKVKNLGAGFLKQAQNIRAAFGMLQTAATAALSHLGKAFQFETMTVQFKTLIGNMGDAREHMAMLQKMGDTPPFSLEEFARASRAMMVMSEGALGFQKSLELVGDAAAATGQPVENLAHEVGRAYAIIRDGQPLSRATMGLRNMGAITPEVAARLEELQKSGASNIEIWNELEAALGKFKGAMKETEQTGDGLMGAISAQWDDAARSFGSAFMDAAKGGLSLVLEKLKRLNEDGSVVKWANTAAKAAVAVKDAFASVGEGVARVSSALGAAFGALESGGGAKGAWRAFRDDVQYGYDNRKHGEELQRTLDAQQADTAAKLAAALKGANAGEGREGGEAAGDDAERARIERQMAEQQAKADAQREWEAAGRDMDKRAHDDQLAEEFLEQVRKDDEEMERKLREQRKRLLEEEFSQRKRELEAAQTAMDGGMKKKRTALQARQLAQAAFVEASEGVELPKSIANEQDPDKRAAKIDRYIDRLKEKKARGVTLSKRDEGLLAAGRDFLAKEKGLKGAKGAFEDAKAKLEQMQLDELKKLRESVENALVPDS